MILDLQQLNKDGNIQHISVNMDNVKLIRESSNNQTALVMMDDSIVVVWTTPHIIEWMVDEKEMKYRNEANR